MKTQVMVVKQKDRDIISLIEASPFSEEEKADVLSRLTPGVVQYIMRQIADTIACQRILFDIDAKIAEQNRIIRASDAHAKRMELKRKRGEVIARVAEVQMHAEGAFESVVSGIRKGKRLQEKLVGLLPLLTNGNDGEDNG